MTTFKPDGSRTLGESSIESQLLYDRLSIANKGDEIAYTELTQICGRNVQTTGYAALQTARNRCEKLNHAVFGTITGKGIRRLTNDEIPETAQSHIQHIRRTARRAAKKLACVDYQLLPDSAKLTHNINLSLLGVLSEVSKPGGSKIIETKIRQDQQALPVGKVMELFRG